MEVTTVHELDTLKAFVLNNTTYHVHIEYVNGDALFKANDIGSVLGLVNIRETIRNYDDDEKSDVSLTDPHGREQVTTFLTEEGVYRLLMQSRKPMARPFQKWVAKVIRSIRETGEYNLHEAVKAQKAITEEAHAKIEELMHQKATECKEAAESARHNALVQTLRANRHLVYIGRIRFHEGKMLIKIGSSKNMHDRAPRLVTEFGDILLLEVFEVTAYIQFEDYLHDHPHMAARRYTEVIHNGRKSNREVFLMSGEELNTAINIARRFAPAFSDSATVDQLLDLERLKAKKTEETAQANEALTERIEELTTVVLDNSHRYTQARGPKVQRYSEAGELLETYEGYTEVCRDAKLAKPTQAALRNAVKSNTMYKGYRWLDLAREMDDNTVQTLVSTVKASTQRIGLVAMLNIDRDAIVEVFPDMKTAAVKRKFSGVSSVSSAITRQSLSSGHYFQMWHECDQVLKDQYLEHHELPRPPVRACALQIVRINPITGAQTMFNSIADVQRDMKVSRSSLKAALETDSILKGYHWKSVEV